MIGAAHSMFLKSIKDGTEPFPGFDVAVQAHKIVELAYRSAKEGVELDIA